MRLLLIEDVPNVGVLGDQVKVKAGYARNYLIPQGKAILADSKKSKELQHRLKYYDKLRQAAIEAAEGKANALKAMSLEITKKAGPNGRLFGSVTNNEIMELLNSKNFDVVRRDILPHEAIKTVGSHTVTVKLHTSVKVEIEVKVIGDVPESLQKAPEAAQPVEEAADATEEVNDSNETETNENGESSEDTPSEE